MIYFGLSPVQIGINLISHSLLHAYNTTICVWKEHYPTTLSVLLHVMKGYNTHSIPAPLSQCFCYTVQGFLKIIVMLELFTLHLE